MTTVIEAIIYDDYSMIGRTNQVLQSNSYCVEIAFEEDHLCRRGRSPNKEIKLLLLLSLGILNMGHTLVHILL